MLINSPRSLEACRRQGIEPKELVFRTEKQLKKQMGVEAISLTPQIIQLRWEHFEQRRKEKINLIFQERQGVMQEEEQGLWSGEGGFIGQMSKHSSTGSGGKGAASLHQGRRTNSVVTGPSKMMVSAATESAMIEQERKALEKIKLKQQKEIEQMMEYERKMQEIRDRNDEKQR